MTVTICKISSHIRSVAECSIAPLTVRLTIPYGFIGFKSHDVGKDVVLYQGQVILVICEEEFLHQHFPSLSSPFISEKQTFNGPTHGINPVGFKEF